MADYLELPLIDDADALTELGLDYLQQMIDGYVARPANVETILVEANAQIGAEIVAQAALVPPIIFAYLGQNLLGIAPYPAAPAVGSADVTFAADAVVTLDAGAMIAVPNPDGNTYVFTLDDDVVSPAGGGVVTQTISALEAGANANGSYGSAELIDVVDGVASISVVTPTSGGADEETDDEYLDRLASAMTILAPRPILPSDHADFALLIEGVGRALAIDLLQPPASSGGVNTPTGKPAAPWGPEPNGTTDVPRCTTVAITAEDGTAPPHALMQTVLDELDAAREVNFLNYVIPPTYGVIQVQATIKAYPGFTAAEVQEQALAVLADWLNPLAWGTTSAWTQETTVRLYEAIDYLNRAPGVSYVVSVQLRKSGGAWAAQDVVLSGLAPLPTFDAAGSPITVQTS
jgi:hypothetical protein